MGTHRNVFLALAAALLLGACAAPSPPEPVAPVAVHRPAVPKTFPNILFETAAVDLSVEQRDQIRSIAEVLKSPSAADRAVLVTGHTDRLGSEAANEKAGMRRAEAVARELVFNGIASERITVRSQGERQPAAPETNPDGTDNPQGRALNRRVEIVIQD